MSANFFLNIENENHFSWASIQLRYRNGNINTTYIETINIDTHIATENNSFHDNTVYWNWNCSHADYFVVDVVSARKVISEATF